MSEGGKSSAFNLGNGEGHSVLEVINAVKRITKKDFRVNILDRRAGDPPRLIGSSEKAQEILGWNPEFNSIETIIETAWTWHQKMFASN